MSARRHGFTLLELLLAIMIGLLLMSIAVPSVSGMLREQRLKKTFDDFDEFVRRAQTKAVTEGHTQVLVWDKTGIDLVVFDPSKTDDHPSEDHFPFPDDTKWALRRPAALVKKPVWEWPFWRSGACEPVIVSYESAAGTWSAEYNGLTGRGKVVEMEVK